MEINELEAYYRENFNKLVKSMSYRCHNVQDAEDVVQTAFERAIKYWETSNPGEDKLGAWFGTILRNSWKDNQAVVRLGAVTKPLDSSTKEIEPVLPDHITPLIVKEVRAMVAAEPAHIREMLRLHLEFGLGQGEISSILEGVSKKRVNDAIRNFRTKVLKRYE